MTIDRSHATNERASVASARAWLAAQLKALSSEDVAISQVAGRILAEEVRSNLDLPPFDRATVDGIAVRADETIGASTYNPSVFHWATAGADLPAGAATRLNAGEPLPSGADAVVRLEHVGFDEKGAGTVTDPVMTGSGAERKGSQSRRHGTLLAAGRRLRPGDIGLLASAGLTSVSVI